MHNHSYSSLISSLEQKLALTNQLIPQIANNKRRAVFKRIKNKYILEIKYYQRRILINQ